MSRFESWWRNNWFKGLPRSVSVEGVKMRRGPWALVVSAAFGVVVAGAVPMAVADSLPDRAMVAKGAQPDWGWDCQARAKDHSGLVFEGRRTAIKRYADGFERSWRDEVRTSGAVSQVVDEDGEPGRGPQHGPTDLVIAWDTNLHQLADELDKA